MLTMTGIQAAILLSETARESTERDEDSANEWGRGNNGAHDPSGSRVNADTGICLRSRTES